MPGGAGFLPSKSIVQKERFLTLHYSFLHQMFSLLRRIAGTVLVSR